MPEDVSKLAQDKKTEVSVTSKSQEVTLAGTDHLTQEGKQEKKVVNLRRILKLYVFPLVILTIFAGIVFVLIIPRTFGILEEVNQINEINAVNSELVQELRQLDALASRNNQINADLTAIDSVVPEGNTEVVSFQQKLKELAENRHNLTLLRAETSESALADEEEAVTATSRIPLIEIPSTFQLQGSLGNVKAFVNDINLIDDFVIVDEMSLAQSGGVWELDIVFVKYQFLGAAAAVEPAEIYRQVPVTAQPTSEVIDFIEGKL